MMDEPIHIEATFGDTSSPSAEAHPAQVRPGPHVHPPAATDPSWFDRLNATMDLHATLMAARQIGHARNPIAEPGAEVVIDSLRIANAMLLEAMATDRDGPVVWEYYRQVVRELRRLHVQV